MYIEKIIFNDTDNYVKKSQHFSTEKMDSVKINFRYVKGMNSNDEIYMIIPFKYRQQNFWANAHRQQSH